MTKIAKYIIKYRTQVINWAKKNLSAKKFKELYDAIKAGLVAVQEFCGRNAKTCWSIFWNVITNLI